MTYTETMLSAMKKACSIVALPIYTCVQVCFIPLAYSSPPIAASTGAYQSASESIFSSLQKLDGGMDLALPWRLTESNDHYIFTRTEEPDFLQVTERLPAGGFGRILRYRGWVRVGQWVDLEFVYQDEVNRILILDYKAGRFFRTTFKGKKENPGQIFPAVKNILTGDLTVSQSVSFKWIGSSRASIQNIMPEIERLHTQLTDLSDVEAWSKDKVRGPPAGGIAL